MKAKRRHELQQNVLDAELGKAMGFFKRHGTPITWGAFILGLVVMVVGYVYRRSSQKDAARRQEYRSLVLYPSPEMVPQEQVRRLEALANQTDDEAIAAEACLKLADGFALRAGIILDIPARAQTFERADAYYRRALQRFGEDDLTAARAHIGLAKLAETRGQLDVAQAEYQAVGKMESLAGQPLLAMANAGLQTLETLREPVPMVDTLPSTTAPATQPTTQPATAPATPSATRPTAPPATVPATQPAP